MDISSKPPDKVTQSCPPTHMIADSNKSKFSMVYLDKKFNIAVHGIEESSPETKGKTWSWKSNFFIIRYLLLLGIYSVWNHCKAWSITKASVLICLYDLLRTCKRFELIGTILHVVTKQEEEEAWSSLEVIGTNRLHQKYMFGVLHTNLCKAFC